MSTTLHRVDRLRIPLHPSVSQKIDDLPVLVTCGSGTSVKLKVQFYIKALENDLAFCDEQNFLRGFPRKYSNVSRIRKSYSNQSRTHLAVSTE